MSIISQVSSFIQPTIVTKMLLYTVSGTLSSIKNILSNNSLPEIVLIKEKLESMDLENKLEIIHSLIIDLRESNLKEYHKKAIENLNQLVDKIKVELDDVNQKINYHLTKYLYSWRALDLNNNILNIQHHNNILDKRLNLLFKLLNINYQRGFTTQ